MNESEWDATIDRLANKKGVKTIPVENFLMTVGNNDNEMSAMMNAESDTGMYKWNSATQGAIYEGISIYFNQVKPKANETGGWCNACAKTEKGGWSYTNKTHHMKQHHPEVPRKD